MAKALIIGAGAIGRGFLPWVFQDLDFDLFDLSEDLCTNIRKQRGYSSYMTSNKELSRRFFQPVKCTSLDKTLDLSEYTLTFIAVGPRNCAQLPESFSGLECPIYSLENDPSTVETISKRLNSNKVFFGVPDVITSSTASPENLIEDPLSLHTENGILFLEANDYVSSEIQKYLPSVVWASRDEMIREWNAKLFLHNTPHCVAAYLGFLDGRKYLHESFENKFIVDVVEGVLEELILAMKRITNYDHDFLENYADKELSRFSNRLLFDPIVRVAREPLRKLARGGRLLGGLELCVLAGVNPVNINLGIAAALNYSDSSDRDHNAIQEIDAFGLTNFLKYFVGLTPETIESRYIVKYYEEAKGLLRRKLLWS